jgi:type II secretory pathway component GspD/PulD (secretin)
MRTRSRGRSRSLLVLLCAASSLIGSCHRKGGSEDAPTFSSFDTPDARSARALTTGPVKFADAEVSAVLDIYQQVSARTVIRGEALPQAKITLQREAPLPRREALQMLDTVLAENGITMVLMGTQFVKAVPTKQAVLEAGPVIDSPREQLPESSSYMVRIIKLKHQDPTEIIPALAPLAKLPNSIVAIRNGRILILRDYSANIRRMLQVVEKMDAVDWGQVAPVPGKPSRR